LARIPVILLICLAFLVGCRPRQQKVNWFPEEGVVNWEAEKQQKAIPSDIIVIHHTAMSPGISWQTLSDIGLNKFFAPCFSWETGTSTPPDVRGMQVQSNHFRDDGTEVYYVYHWLIREDGTTERLLKDGEVGWQAGDMQTNYRSIAIVFDGDYSQEPPPEAALKACAKLIADYEQKQRITAVIGHRDVTHGGQPVRTECPGSWWLDGGKDKLLGLVEKLSST